MAAIRTALETSAEFEPSAIELEPSGDPDTFPSLAIFDSGSSVIEREASLTRREMHLTIEGYVQRGDGAEASAERNELQAAVVEALMTGDSLNGLVEQVEDGELRMMTAVLATERRLAFSQDFSIQFVTQRNSPAVPA